MYYKVVIVACKLSFSFVENLCFQLGLPNNQTSKCCVAKSIFQLQC